MNDRTRWILLALLVVSILVNYIDRGALSVAVPGMEDDFSMSPYQKGMLLSAFFWTYALLQLPAGWLVDRLGWIFARRVADGVGLARRIGNDLRGVFDRDLRGARIIHCERLGDDANTCRTGRGKLDGCSKLRRQHGRRDLSPGCRMVHRSNRNVSNRFLCCGVGDGGRCRRVRRFGRPDRAGAMGYRE